MLPSLCVDGSHRPSNGVLRVPLLANLQQWYACPKVANRAGPPVLLLRVSLFPYITQSEVDSVSHSTIVNVP